MSSADTLANITLVLFFVGFVPVGTYIVKSVLFFRYMRENLPDAWKALGAQDGWSTSTYGNEIRYIKFLILKKYNNLTDVTAVRRAAGIRILLLVCLIWIPIIFVLVLIQIVRAASVG